jgi:hypothetical protein
VSEAVAVAGMTTGDGKARFHRPLDDVLQANVPGGAAGHGEEAVQ